MRPAPALFRRSDFPAWTISAMSATCDAKAMCCSRISCSRHRKASRQSATASVRCLCWLRRRVCAHRTGQGAAAQHRREPCRARRRSPLRPDLQHRGFSTAAERTDAAVRELHHGRRSASVDAAHDRIDRRSQRRGSPQVRPTRRPAFVRCATSDQSCKRGLLVESLTTCLRLRGTASDPTLRCRRRRSITSARAGTIRITTTARIRAITVR